MGEIAVALNRFGLGARGDETPPASARPWLIDQFERFVPRPQTLAELPSRASIADDLAERAMPMEGADDADADAMRAMRRERRQAARAASGSAAMDEGAGEAAPPADPVATARRAARRVARVAGRDAYLAMIGARTTTALRSETPFVERLVHFWANHFAVSADKLTVIGMAGLLEFEAIRPNVLARFEDMLGAVERHPAMLLYLDQAQSVGPTSPFGTRVAERGRRRVGLNENLAREILELHTLGVRGGYTQADVTELARAMTGFTVAGIARGPAQRLIEGRAGPGDFAFVPAIHEPGARTVLGARYDQPGEAQAGAILTDLARHPATARHLSTKLARHFTTDTPPESLVARLEAAWIGSGGDLPTVYRALIDAPEAWAAPGRFRTPWDWTIASGRALSLKQMGGQQAAGLLVQLGQPVWRPGSPAGWDDLDASWAGPDALIRRVEAAERMAGRVADRVDARALAGRLMPDAVGAATAQSIDRAESGGQALALMLVAPEFMRR